MGWDPGWGGAQDCRETDLQGFVVEAVTRLRL